MKEKLLYFDHNATTKVDARVLSVFIKASQENFANPSAREHSLGETSHRIVLKGLREIASVLDCKPQQITLTSGATEGINQALVSICNAASNRVTRLLVNPLEHKAVLSTCEYIERTGKAEVIWLKNTSTGDVLLDEVSSKAEFCDAIVVMAANNELGTIYPFEEIGKIAEKHNCHFVCDATQALGKIPFSFERSRASHMIGSAHKFYGPKGIGLLVSREPKQLKPLIYGGGQQDFRRSGTLNVPGLVGMAKALEISKLEGQEESTRIEKIRDHLQGRILQEFPEAIVLGNLINRLPGTLAVSFPGIPNDAVLARVSHRLAISTGSACTVGVEESSHVYRALGYGKEVVQGVLRISVGRFNTQEESTEAAALLIEAVRSTKEQLACLVA